MTEPGSLLASNVCGSVGPVGGWLAQLKSDPLGGRSRGQVGILEVHFYTLDLIVGFALPAFVHLRNRSRPDGTAVIRLFWLGVAIGFTWEIPIFLSALLATDPLIGFLREPPLHPIIFMVAHAFWDGGLFLAGVALVQALCAHPVFATFRWQELAVLVLWGQLSEVSVEVVSVLNQGWVYSGRHAWNPVLFHVAGHPITIIPQLIWLVAPVAYYFSVLSVARQAPAGRRGVEPDVE